MSTPKQNSSPACGAKCEKCAHTDETLSVITEPLSEGIRLAASSAVVFLLPLALAVTAAVLLREHRVWQVIAVLTGLAIGTLIARPLAPRIAGLKGKRS